MKLLIISHEEYIGIPYIQKYEEIMNKNSIQYDIILWDRRNTISQPKENWLVFKAKNYKHKILKIIPFLKWRRFVLRQLKAGNYDKLIVVTTIPGILLYDIILKKYKGNFLFDYRDSTYEKIPVYRFMVEKLIDNSNITTFSSNAFFGLFKIKLNGKVHVTHNISNIDNCVLKASDLTEKMSINIGFVGSVRYYEINKRLIEQFANSKKYKFSFIGKQHHGNTLVKFCIKNDIKNVEFKPEFYNEQKPEIYKDIDIINSVYGDRSSEVKLALPNKLYDCLIYKKPIIVSSNTYLAEVVNEYNLGKSVDLETDNIKDIIDEYIENFNNIEFSNSCEKLKKIVIEEETETLKHIEKYIVS